MKKAAAKARVGVLDSARVIARLAKARESIDHEAQTSLERAQEKRAVIERAAAANGILRKLRIPDAWIRVLVVRGGLDETPVEYYRNGNKSGPLRARLIEAFELELDEALLEVGINL